MLLKVYECNKGNYFNLVMSASTLLFHFKLVHMLEILTQNIVLKKKVLGKGTVHICISNTLK